MAMRLEQVIYVSLVGLALSGCTSKAEKNQANSELRTLPVTTLTVKDTVLHRSYVASIEAVQNVEIRARVDGFLDTIHVDEGKMVRKGQVLFTIGNEEYISDLAKAKAALSNVIAEAKGAALEVERVKLLVEKKVIAGSELDVAKARLAAAEAKTDEARSALNNAENKLKYTKIRAPFTGVIDRIPLKNGSLIREGTLFTTISDVHAVYAYFNVSETEYLQYIKSRKTADMDMEKVRLVLADETLYPYPGTIETIEGEFEENTGSIAFRAKFPNPKHLLKHGASGKVLLSNEVSNAILVPQKAVFEMQDKNYVFVLNQDNKVQMRNFIPRNRMKDCYLVGSGLKEGETIVAEGVLNIRDGMTIEPLKRNAESAQ